jgi:hypothetical protein
MISGEQKEEGKQNSAQLARGYYSVTTCYYPRTETTFMCASLPTIEILVRADCRLSVFLGTLRIRGCMCLLLLGKR